MVSSIRSFEKSNRSLIGAWRNRLWWLALVVIWLLSTWFDRIWLFSDQRLPSWDQAEYLSSALEHGRSLGLLSTGQWQGWAALLDLSPKIPPLSSLISGTVMAVAGESADQASWVLSLWFGLLLFTVASWGRMLGGKKLGLFAAAVLAISPALAEHRVEFHLDLPLAATCTLALWLLFRWQRPAPEGGRWSQALAAAVAIAAALLIKQSALLVVALPSIWAVVKALKLNQRRWQALFGLAVVVGILLPWLHHNWITTIGGTHRAVLISGAKEGDPGLFDPLSLLWYPSLWPNQFGVLVIAGALSGLLLCVFSRDGHVLAFLRRPMKGIPADWKWLIAVTLSAWLCTSLSPNKDPRYFAPVLPLLALLIAQGWLFLLHSSSRKIGTRLAWTALLGCFAVSAVLTARQRWSELTRAPGAPAIEMLEELRVRSGNQPATLLLVASKRNFNEQTLSYLGQLDGRNIQARRMGRHSAQLDLTLDQSEWWVLATGDQGTSRKSRRQLSRAVRNDPRFELLESWDWSKGRQIELWKRKSSAATPEPFDKRFVRMAREMETGLPGLESVFTAIGPWHLLDPQFEYQRRVETWAHQRLITDGNDRDALWSLAMLAALQNRPKQAEVWFAKLEQIYGKGSWASVYRMVVLIADWQSCKAAWLASDSLQSSQHPDQRIFLTAMRDLARTTCLDPRGPIGLRKSLEVAIEEAELRLKSE